MKILLIASTLYLAACAPLDHYHYAPGGVTSAAVVPGDGCCASGVGPYAPPVTYAPPPPPPVPTYYYREWQPVPAYGYCRGWC